MASALVPTTGLPRVPVNRLRTGVIFIRSIWRLPTRSLASIPWQRCLIQAVLAGILHCWLAERLGRRIFGPRVGLVAAGLSAVYIYFFYYAGALITEPFYITGILWIFDVALRLVDARQNGQTPPHKWRLWIELGVAIGVTALLRQLFLLFVPFLFLWIWWMLAFSERAKPVARNSARWWQANSLASLPGFVLATSLSILLIAPWTVRNYFAFGTLVPLNTNAGYAFFWGNHPIYGTNFVGILPGDGPTYLDLIPSELRPLNEAELDRALLKLGIGFVEADLVRYMLLSLSRTREYFKFWPSAESGRVSNLARVGLVWDCFTLHDLWAMDGGATLAPANACPTTRSHAPALGIYANLHGDPSADVDVDPLPVAGGCGSPPLCPLGLVDLLERQRLFKGNKQ